MKLLILLISCVALFVACQDNDLGVLNYALTLEHLEAAFYKQGVAQFTAADFTNAGYPAYTYPEFIRIAEHEKTHVDVLITVIEASYPNQSVPACEYQFPINGVEGFIAIARTLEETGVSAYLGRVADITSKGYLTAAATIATIEARHSSFINVLSKYSGMPAAFDTPLGVRAVVGIASTLIKSCPYNLGVTPYPMLMTSIESGRLRASFTSTNSSAMLYCAFFGPSSAFTPLANQMCDIPTTLSGDIYVFVTSSMTPLTLSPGGDASVLAGPSILTLVNNFRLESAAATQQPTAAPPSTQAPSCAGGQNVVNINFAGILAGR